MSTELELFNSHQQDLRGRANSLAKAIFLLAGGTLTVSIGIFSRQSAPEINEEIATILISSWWALFASIILFVFTLVIIIVRDYAFGEKWRSFISNKSTNPPDSPTWIEVLIWAVGLLGLISFIIGLLAQAWVATSLIAAS